MSETYSEHPGRDRMYHLISDHVQARFGLSLADLPDSVTLCDALDEWQDADEAEQRLRARDAAFDIMREELPDLGD